MYDADTLAELTTALSSNIDLYNKIINKEQESDSKISTKEKETIEISQKLEDAEKRGANYLGQISNLLSKIPVGETKANKTAEQKIEEIKNQKWSK